MSFSGNGAICSTLTGSFTIADVSFGPHGYVTRLDATFVQHCNGADPALTGEVHILNPPPAPVLAPTLTIANDGFAGRVDGQAKIHGSVTCNVPVSLYLNGTVSQVVKKQILTGNFNLTVNCTPGAAQPWSAGASPYVVPFQKGDVVVNASAGAADPNYGDYISVSQSAVVALLWDKQ